MIRLIEWNWVSADGLINNSCDQTCQMQSQSWITSNQVKVGWGIWISIESHAIKSHEYQFKHCEWWLWSMQTFLNNYLSFDWKFTTMLTDVVPKFPKVAKSWNSIKSNWKLVVMKTTKKKDWAIHFFKNHFTFVFVLSVVIFERLHAYWLRAGNTKMARNALNALPLYAHLKIKFVWFNLKSLSFFGRHPTTKKREK